MSDSPAEVNLRRYGTRREVVLPLHGIGENCFFLNRSFPDGEERILEELRRRYTS